MCSNNLISKKTPQQFVFINNKKFELLTSNLRNFKVKIDGYRTSGSEISRRLHWPIGGKRKSDGNSFFP